MAPLTWRRRRRAERGSAWRENLEAALFAGVLALMIRQYVFQAFKIPSGSMAPTLYGHHKDITCPNCGFWYATNGAPDETRSLRSVLCPNCGYMAPPELLARAACGHLPAWPRRLTARGYYRVLADRFAYDFLEPQRWDVIVFRKPDDGSGAPEEAAPDYIKRIVGLPGDALTIERGNLYNGGQILRKPPTVQEAMWIPVYDSRYRPKSLSHLYAPKWVAEEGAAEWADDVLVVRPGAQGASVWFARAVERIGRSDWLFDTQRAVVTYLAYNRWEEPQLPIGELRLRCRAKLASGSTTRFVIEQDGHAVSCELALSGEGGEVRLYSGASRLAAAAIGPAGDEWRRIEFWHADAAVGVALDGRPLLRAEYDPPAPGPASARLGVEGDRELALRDIRIDRDAYYLRRSVLGGGGDFAPTERPFRVPEGAYYVMGDNSAHSSDSRYWGTVPRERIVGKASVIWWPPTAMRPVN